MISKAKVAKLYKRLEALAKQPEEDETVRRAEVYRALVDAPTSDAHADAIVDHILRTHRFFPVPAEVYIVADQVCDPDRPSVPDGCDKCLRSATGEFHAFIAIERPDGYSGAVRCSCARGRFLKAQDEQRARAERTAEAILNRKSTVPKNGEVLQGVFEKAVTK